MKRRRADPSDQAGWNHPHRGRVHAAAARRALPLLQLGAEELFKSCTIIESDWYDSLAFTVGWMLKSVGLHDKVPAERLDRVVNEIKELEALASHQELRAAASGVYIVAWKPE